MSGRWGIYLFVAVAWGGALGQEKPETWDMPPPREQEELDDTVVPVGKGAIFVPCMSDPQREPPYIVYKDGKRVMTVQMGKKAVLEPGIYEVRIGSLPANERIKKKVLVVEGKVTRVKATWGGLIVQVVDDKSEPFRGTYELVAMPERREIGVGIGADVERGEDVKTWILPAGNYMILKAGESYQARRDFYTIRLQPGELYKMVLVVERDSGAFVGAGQVGIVEPQKVYKNWRLSLLLGGEAEVNRRSDLTGFPSGYGFSLGGFLDFMARHKSKKHFSYERVRIEEKQVKQPNQPFLKDLDEAKADALYMYRIWGWFGPYVRAGVKTSFFPSHLYLTNPTKIEVVDDTGQVKEDLGEQNGKFRISDPFAPVEVKGGTGFAVLMNLKDILDTIGRVGFGGRALFSRGALVPQGNISDGVLKCQRKWTAYNYGLETTVVTSLTLTRWVLATSEFDFLLPVHDYKNPIIDFENNVAIRVFRFISLNYVFRLILDKERSEHLQTEHRVLLRLTWKIL